MNSVPKPFALHRRRFGRFQNHATKLVALLAFLQWPWLMSTTSKAAEENAPTPLQNAAVNAQLGSDEARFAISAEIKGRGESREDSLATTRIFQSLEVDREWVMQTNLLEATAIRGELRELILILAGEGSVTKVTGPGLEDWSLRESGNGSRALVLRLGKSLATRKSFSAEITAKSWVDPITQTASPLTFTPEHPALGSGFIRLRSSSQLAVELHSPTGVLGIDTAQLPETLHPGALAESSRWLAFQFLGTRYTLPLTIKPADPEYDRVVISDYRLEGRLENETADFALRGVARVKNPKGGSLDLLGGSAALTEYSMGAGWALRLEGGRYKAVFERAGDFPFQIQFHATIQASNGWNRVHFQTAPAALQPITLSGLNSGTQFKFPGAAQPESKGDVYQSFLTSDGQVDLSWKLSKAEVEGTLFFAVDQLGQATLRPGMVRQTTALQFQITQGELTQASILVQGNGEITRVQGASVLGWKIDSIPNTPNRRLRVQFNQPQRDPFGIVIQTQTALDHFPATANLVQLQPEGATRSGGHFRISNEGAVKVEVIESLGLSQISPSQFPQSESSKALGPVTGSQVFAYRYSGGDYSIKVQADDILPEVSVSQITDYHVGEAELVIETELELDIREAPLREWTARIPRGFSVTRLDAAGLVDSFVTELPGQEVNQLRAVYSAPIEGRQVIQLRLERNVPLGTNSWTLPKVEIEKARSSRGQIAISADPGFRTSPAMTPGLTEIATAFFPRKLPRLQSAFRLAESNWQARMNVERLPQMIQVDALHLFSVGEGIAYGSSLLNFRIAGAPLTSFRVALTNEYFNVEFTGKDVRNWQRVEGGYVVQLHTPVSGPYTLLATYERPFKAQGDSLRFIGAQPLDAQSEQGHTVIVSTHQFQVQPVNLSEGLSLLEPGELPSEYRLLFDAPILAAYRYSSRPFNLQLNLQPLAQQSALSQLVERASIVTRISKEGQAVTEARYFIKSQNLPHLRVTLPPDSELWNTSVNETDVIPIDNGTSKLIPLRPKPEASALQEVRVKIASRTPGQRRIHIAAPTLGAPILLADWHLQGESGQRIQYIRGSLLPTGTQDPRSLIQSIRRNWISSPSTRTWGSLFTMTSLFLVGIAVIRLSTMGSTHRFSLRHASGGVVAGLAFAIAAYSCLQLSQTVISQPDPEPADVRFAASVLPPDAVLSTTISSSPMTPSLFSLGWAYWPVVLGVSFCVSGRLNRTKATSALLGWSGSVLMAWGLLRQPHGTELLRWAFPAWIFLALAIPCARRWWSVSIPPHKPPHTPTASSSNGPANALASLLLWLSLGIAFAPTKVSAQAPAASNQTLAIADSTLIQASVNEGFVQGKATLRWRANKGDFLPLLHAPSILTHLDVSPQLARLVQVPLEGQHFHALLAESSGLIQPIVEFQVPIRSKGNEQGFTLPFQPGLVHRLSLVFTRQDTEITAPEAVSIQSIHSPTSEQFTHELVLSPTQDPWIGWKPRARNTRLESALFFAEWHHLIVPTPGVVEGIHQVLIRPAQGELNEVSFETSPGSTITDVASPLVTQWRFDPATNRLRVSLSQSQSRPFTLVVHSQVQATPLPYERAIGLLRVLGAAEQSGFTGIATGTEVQLEAVTGPVSSPIHLEDFPRELVDRTSKRMPELTLRRAFRQEGGLPGPVIRAAAVEADIRADLQQTVSLAEDRTLLAANLMLNILRAGIFKFSFPLPQSLEVESISGGSLSHWTETTVETNRWIHLHFKSRTEGQQTFAISLTGAGIRTAARWMVPKISIREASRQTGQLVLTPEQGLRLQIVSRESLTQLDPQHAGIRQKGVLLFRILQPDWKLSVDLERVDAWTQVTSLQLVSVDEARVQTQVNLLYEIENAGLKVLQVRLPRDAQGVQFRGDQVADFGPATLSTNALTRDWEIKLHRRINGRQLIQAHYSHPLAPGTTNWLLQGVEALGVNLQRGFLSIQSANRIQTRLTKTSNPLQPSDPQTIPRELMLDLSRLHGDSLFRVADPLYTAQVEIHRHEVAKVLPSRVERLTLTTVPSHDGALLTRVELTLMPGEKQLLPVILPMGTEFWSAFVAGNDVRTWREGGHILIPLEQHARDGDRVIIEFYYASPPPIPGSRAEQLALACPRFDLPLENIRWNVFLDSGWEMKSWTGGLQLDETVPPHTEGPTKIETYVQRIAADQLRKTQEATGFLTEANSLMEKGNPEAARRAFQNAYGLSRHDVAFNEDARVQLHNLKTQQALIGLNYRQTKVTGEVQSSADSTGQPRAGLVPAYTQQQARQLIEGRSAEENAIQMRLVERLIQQQEATSANPVALRASLPDLGVRLSFSKSIQIEKQNELQLFLQIRPRTPPESASSLFLVLVLGAGLALLQRLRAGLSPEGSGKIAG